jgi:hypothetical protein
MNVDAIAEAVLSIGVSLVVVYTLFRLVKNTFD